MKTKLLSILIMLSMIISLTAIPTSAAETLTLSVSDVTAQPGETITVEVDVDSNPGVASMMFDVNYDSVLTLTGISLNGSFGTVTTPPTYKNPQTIGMMSPVSNVTTTGAIATLTFKVADNAPIGYVARITISYSSDDFYDVDFNPVSVRASGGKVTVRCLHQNTTNVPEEPATCNQGGFTAGVFCNTCQTYISGHQPTDPTGEHVDADSAWEKDDNNHWHTCSCGQIFESTTHSGGTATCKVKAVCEYCGVEYGTISKDNHVGGTTLINEKPADHKTQTPGYTGDVKCNDCGEIITYGRTVNPDAHTPANGWTTDGSHHWKVCSVDGCGYVLSDTKAGHTSTGTNQANCQRPAICDVCGATYGDVATHSYTVETKSANTLKTAGDCCNEAVYYYSCSGCGAVERNDNHTFKSDKDANNHVGGTTLVGASDADHKTQTPGYTGDTKCNGCGTVITYGQAVNPQPHIPVAQYNTDENNHWQICAVAGCGVVIEESKGEHTSTGNNKANCQRAAICDVCGISYGTVTDHKWSASWEHDDESHWHKCMTSGCKEIKDKEAHVRDHNGGATEEYAIRCTECQYIIEAQLAHPHEYNLEVATDAYKATDATCSTKATYYKSCRCGEKGTETFEYGDLLPHTLADATCTLPQTCTECGATEGEALGHTPADEWHKDATGHWKTCGVEGCGATLESTKAAHTPDHEGGATEEYPIRCTACQYIIEAQLAHPHKYDKEVATSEYKATNATCTAKATYYKSCRCGDKGTESFEYGDVSDHSFADATCTLPKTCTECGVTEGEALGHTAGGEWNKDKDNHWYVCVTEGCGAVIEATVAPHTPDRDAPTETDPVLCTVCGYMIAPELSHVHSYGEEWKSDDSNHWTECVCGDKTEAQAHTDEDKNGECDACGYGIDIPTEDPTDPTPVPKQNDNLILWVVIAAVAVVAVVVIIILATKKKGEKK